MRILETLVLAALPLLAAAVPVEDAAPGFKVALARGESFADEDGIANLEALSNHHFYSTQKIARALEHYETNTAPTHSSFIDVKNSHSSFDKRNYGHCHKRKHVNTAPPESAFPPSSTPASTPAKAIPLTSYKRALWFGEILAGTPAQKFQVVFDTGSSDILLPGPNCTDANCEGHTIFDVTKSSTSKPAPAPNGNSNFRMSYGDGSNTTGHAFYDTFTVGGATDTEQIYGLADTYNAGFKKSRFPADGLFGLAFQNSSIYHQPTFSDRLSTQKLVPNPVFSIKLAVNDSELLIGGVNSRLYKGDFTHVPITEKAFWKINVDSISTKGSFGVKTFPSVQGIIDSGTSYVYGQPAQIEAIYKAVPGAKNATAIAGPGMYTVPCDNIPTFNLTIGGRGFPIDPKILNQGRINGTNDCVSGLAATTNANFWVIGGVFLQNVYTTFDTAKATVGFAQLA